MAPVALQELKSRPAPLRSKGWAVSSIVLVAVAVSFAAAFHWKARHDLQVRLLIADPDAISGDRNLIDYAMPLGRVAYDGHCAGCHGVRMQGDPARGVPNLADADWLYGTGRVGEIERVVAYGVRSGHSKTLKLASMPAFATQKPYSRYTIEPLDRHEVDDLTALIYSFQHKPEDAESVKRGSNLYHGKGLCFDCHGDHATGDPAIGAPNLTDAVWLSGDGSMEAIRASIQRGAAGICPQFISRLPPETIRAIAVYVNSFHS